MPFGPGNPIILKPEVLSEEYVPKRIVSRERETALLRECLSPVLRNERPLHAWLFGRPGTGKTLTAKYLADEVCRGSKACFVHVNCRKYSSSYSILDRILNELRLGFGNARDRRIKLEKIERALKDRPAVIILDEIDFLPQKERGSLIYSLCFGKIGLVCISEDRLALTSLNSRAKSRFHPLLIEFPQYQREELVEILRERASFGLASDSWEESILGEIAVLSNGDARTAIQTLRNAAELGQSRSSKGINVDHISRAFIDMNCIDKEGILKNLGEHCSILYGVIERKPVLSTELWETYLKECRQRGIEPAAKRTYSHYLNKMVRHKLIEFRTARVRGHVYEFRVRG